VNEDIHFPTDFVWGTATAAYQIEGAAHEDGRGASIWDTFCATPGKVRNGDDGSTACDFYHRYPEDIGLMRELGLDAFRFSIAWPRVVPDGRGAVNAAGLDFYDRLVDELLAEEIEPYVTLYHWDLPQALQDEGGWPARSTAEAFAEYAGAVVGRLGDRVRNWMTHNEPWVVAWLGYGEGRHAPGHHSNEEAVAAAHHLLLSHGWATELIRRDAPGAQAGIALNLTHSYPASPTEADRDAARVADGHLNRWFLDPIFRGSYPEDMLDRFAPPVRDGDLEAIAAPLDFLGVNYYFRAVVEADSNGGMQLVRPATGSFTAMDWEVYPEALTRLLTRVAEEYRPPAIYITENGAAYDDYRSHDGEIYDSERQSYLDSHLTATARAIELGAPVKGYFLWSLLDNVEWALGYSKRFGIVYVDYPTLERIPKASFSWYRDFIAQQREAAGAWKASV
jgi:beta-glucosidase